MGFPPGPPSHPLCARPGVCWRIAAAAQVCPRVGMVAAVRSDGPGATHPEFSVTPG